MLLDAGTPQDLTAQALIPTREQIERLEAQMRMMEQLPIVTALHVAAGIRALETAIPAGRILPSAAHTDEHLCIVSKGRIAVWMGDSLQILSAPHMSVTPAGMRCVGFALEDTVWVTIHRNLDNKDA